MIRILTQIILLPLKLPIYLYKKIRSRGKIEFIKFTLKGKLEETPPSSGMVTYFKPEPQKFYHVILQLGTILESLKKGKLKKTLKEISIHIHGPRIGWSRAWEIRQVLSQLAEHCTVRAYLLSGDSMSYYIASACNEIYTSPAMNIDLVGNRIESMFFKGLFDKWSIKPDFIHIGKFKSAAERFTRKSSSPFAKKQNEALLKNIQEQIKVALNARDSKLKKKDLSALQHEAPYSAAKAFDFGLIDGILYENQFEQLSEKQFNKKNIKRHSLEKSVNLLAAKATRLFDFRKTKKIVMVVADGPIVDSSEPAPAAISFNDYHHTFKELKQNHFDALLLRINSPGGSAVVSDMLWQDLMSLKLAGSKIFEDNSPWLKIPEVSSMTPDTLSKKKEKKPKKEKKKKKEKRNPPEFFVSQSDVAASGGYYLSSISNNVFATPLTITGSIGVIGGKFNLEGLLKKLGISIDSVEAGKNANIYSMFDSFTPAQRKKIEENMTDMYALFRNRITIGRGIEDKVLKKLGEGRVYSGTEANKLGLVDHEGGLLATLAKIKETLKLKDNAKVQLEIYPQIKAPLFSKSQLLPASIARLKVLSSLSKENILVIDDSLI